MFARRIAVLVVFAALVGGSTGCGMSNSVNVTQTEADGGNATAVLVMERCTQCHDTKRIDAADHDEAGWMATVTRMQGNGANVSDEEKAKIVAYLAARR